MRQDDMAQRLDCASTGLPPGGCAAESSRPVVVDSLFETTSQPGIRLAKSTRTEARGAGFVCKIDQIAEDENRVFFLRMDGGARATLRTHSEGVTVTSIPAGGWLVKDAAGQQVWIPHSPMWRCSTENGQIVSEALGRVAGLATGEAGNELGLEGPTSSYLDLVLFHLGTGATRELEELTRLETDRFLIWGSHCTYRKPADAYRFLVQGAVFEPRTCWPFYRRICAENDAHALYVLLSGLLNSTQKRLYDLLRQQVLLSVIDRQEADGGWYHGEWTEGYESHFRLVAAGLQLVTNYRQECGDPHADPAMQSAAEFLSRGQDQHISHGWFLHDSLELSEAGMAASPFRWTHSRAFGKSVSNMLVLNTHLDTLIALHRYGEVTGDSRYETQVESARDSLRLVLRARPAEWLYRLLFSSITQSFLPTAEAACLPLHKRAWKRIGWKYLVPRLHLIKKIFPRIVMPGGFIDRALSLHGISIPYQAINMMDLARYAQRFPDDRALVMAVLEPAFDLVVNKGLRRRWEDDEKTRYAIGFWAETLYHLCLLDRDDSRYRYWLADAMLRAEVLELGQAPSLLGANAEAVPPLQQIPTPSPEAPALRIANLSCGKALEFVVANTGDAPEILAWEKLPPGDLSWEIMDSPGKGDLVPPGGWAWGRGQAT